MKMRRSFVHVFNLVFMIVSSSVWYEVLSSGVGEGGLGDLAQILAQLSGGNDCRFKCPRGYKPLANPKHKPSSDGCGSMGIQLDTSHSPGFTQCCNAHDVCYDTCNNDRNQCDEDFKSCLDNVCLLEGLGNRQSEEQIKGCKTGSDLMYSGTVTLGCMSYKEAQRNACLCNGRKLTKKEVEELEQSEKEEL